MPIDWSGKKQVSLYESRNVCKLSSTQLFWLLGHCFSIFLILVPAVLRATQGTKGLLYNWTIKYGSLGNFRYKENMFCVLREVNYEREETDLPKTLTEMYMSIQTFYSARTQNLFKKTASTLIRLLILELNLLQCDDFNRGHSRLFNPSEADSLTKNFDFVFLKANQICS